MKQVFESPIGRPIFLFHTVHVKGKETVFAFSRYADDTEGHNSVTESHCISHVAAFAMIYVWRTVKLANLYFVGFLGSIEEVCSRCICTAFQSPRYTLTFECIATLYLSQIQF